MAPAVVMSSSGGSEKQFEGKITIYVVICGIIAATGGLMFGYDIGISGCVQERSGGSEKQFEGKITIYVVICEIIAATGGLMFGYHIGISEADKLFLAAKGSVPIGIGNNSHIKRAIIDKSARIGDIVKIIDSDNVQEATREMDG